MPLTSVSKDPEALTMTVVADFNVPLPRLWDAYADPRQIEKFWSPPGWPVTFTRHDMTPGGRSEYMMTGPDGQTSAGYWEFLSVDAPNTFEIRDGSAGADGSPNPDLPSTRMVYAFSQTRDGSRLHVTTHFNTLEQLEQLLEMGMEEGLRAEMGQIDDVVSDLASFAAGRVVEAQVLSDTTVRLSRVIRGSVEEVWDAHHDPEILRRWMLGPDGWSMPVCEPATAVGEQYRYEWESSDGDGRFGFTGEVLESAPPVREVTTERLIDSDGPATTNEMTLTSTEAGTLLTIVITYPDVQVRDQVLATGMTDGMEASYVRLEQVALAPA